MDKLCCDRCGAAVDQVYGVGAECICRPCMTPAEWLLFQEQDQGHTDPSDDRRDDIPY